MCCSAASNGASDWHGSHHEANTLSTTTLPRNWARVSVREAPSNGSARRELGATGYLPCSTRESIDDVSVCLETPNVSRASSPTAAATINPGSTNRRTDADEIGRAHV